MNLHRLLRCCSRSSARPFAFALACTAGWGFSTLRAADLPPPNTLLLSGKLKQANVPSQGEHDFRFQLYDRETGGQIPPGSRDVTMTRPVTAGDWQVVLDVRQFGAEVAILDNTVHGGPEVIHPPQGYVGILDDTVRPPQSWVSILDNTVRPPMGSRSILDNTVHTATALNWRAAQGTWLQISVRRKGGSEFVPLSPRQRLTAVPGAVVAQTANHALVAGTVAEGGVDTRALAPGAITAEKLSVGAIENTALANLAVTAPKIASLTVVRSLNGLQDDVTLAAGTGLSLSASGNTITLASTGTGGGGTPLPNGNFMGVNNENALNASTNSVIGGGRLNQINTSTEATIAGGLLNVSRGDFAAIGGGFANSAGFAGSVGGGWGNQAKGQNSVVGGGYFNTVEHNSATSPSGDLTGFEFIGSGQNNSLTDSRGSAIVGGERNRIENSLGSVIGGGGEGSIDRDSNYSFLGGGNANRIGTNSSRSVLMGGANNTVGANSEHTVIAGGQLNYIGDSSSGSFIAAGYNNAIADNVLNAVIAGGYANIARDGNAITIAGGSQNTAAGTFATIGGGASNFAGADATVSGGSGNRAVGTHTTIGGGVGNEALGHQSVIGGGTANVVETSANGTISGGNVNVMTNSAYGFIGGGEDNRILAARDSVIAGGGANTAGTYFSAILGGEGNRTEGAGGYASVLGGSLNLASGSHALAAGRRAEARHTGSFVWNAFPGRSDSTPFVSQQDGEFAARAYGGFRLVTEGTDVGSGDITLDAGSAALRAAGKSASFNFTQSLNVTAGGGVNFTTGGQGLFVDGQHITAGGVGGGNGPINVITGGGFNLPQARLTQENPQDFARLRMETGQQAWDIAAGPDGSLRFFGGGTDRLVLGADGVQISTGAGGLTVNGRAVAFVDQLGQGQPGNGSAVSATVVQGAALTGTSQDTQGGVGVVATGRVGLQATSANPQGAAVQAIQLNGSGYAGDFAGRVKVSSTLEANGGLRVGGSIRVTGLGDNTPTAAFRLVPERLTIYTAANPGAAPTLFAVLDHPSLNGNPEAMLLLTPVTASAYKLYQRNSDVLRGDFLTYFPDAPESPASLRGRWTIDISPAPGGPVNASMAVFNALIVTP